MVAAIKLRPAVGGLDRFLTAFVPVVKSGLFACTDAAVSVDSGRGGGQ